MNAEYEFWQSGIIVGECCYWYRRFPATPLACHGTPQGTTVHLFCEIEYQPPNGSYNIEVHWYRSRDEESAGILGELLNDENKYLQFETDLIPMNQTFIRQYGLGISRFNSSDRGYYWCQIVVNNVSLSPSPYGYIYSLCSFLDAICSPNQPICAHNLSMGGLQFMAYTLANNNCILQEFHVPASNMTNNTVTLVYTIPKGSDKRSLTTMIPTVSQERLSCNLSEIRNHVCVVGIASGLVILILSSLTVLVLCFYFIRRNRRRQVTKENDTRYIQYDSIDGGEHKETQNDEISEPYYSEIVQNDSSDSGYTMKLNISYSTLQVTIPS